MGVRGRGRGGIRWGNETVCAASRAEALMKTGGESVDHRVREVTQRELRPGVSGPHGPL